MQASLFEQFLQSVNLRADGFVPVVSVMMIPVILAAYHMGDLVTHLHVTVIAHYC